MALGYVLVTTFLTLKTWRLLTANELSFYRFDLKSCGTIQKAGWGFLVFSIFWVGLNAHSGWIRFHEYEGYEAFRRIQIPDELALAQTNPDSWLSSVIVRLILEGEKHFQRASNFGLFTNGEALS